MSGKTYRYTLDFKGNTEGIKKDVGSIDGMLKKAAVAAASLFAAQKIMQAAKAVGDYAKEISGVADTVHRLTGLQGAELDKMAGGVQALGAAYDQDVNEAIKASNVLMRTFGVTGSETFDLLNTGFASAANSNGDLLAQVQRFAPHFREAGMEASEMIALMAESNRLGFGEKATDTIMQGTVRLREMNQATKDALTGLGLNADQIQRDITTGNKSMFEVMQLVSGQMNTLPPQSTEVGNALSAVFGRAGKDAVAFIRELENISVNLDDVNENLQEGDKIQKRWTEALKDFHTIGAQAFAGTADGITFMKAVLLEFVTNAIRWGVDFINMIIDIYNESLVLRGAFQAVGLSFKNAFAGVQLVVKNIITNFQTLGRVLGAILKGNFGEIGSIVREGFADIGNNGREFGEKLGNNFTTAFRNTVNPRETIKHIGLSADDAAQAGLEAGAAFAGGFQAGAGGGGMALPDRPEFTRMASIQGKPLQPFVEGNEEMIESNQALAISYAELAAEASTSLGIIANAFGGTTGSWIGFFSTLMDQIPLLISNIARLTGAQLASATAVVTAKQGESMAGVAAGASKLPFPASLVAIISGVAAVASIFASIPKFWTGGILKGSSFMGDQMLVRANSGEEILRRDDPRHTYNQKAKQQGGSMTYLNVLQQGLSIDGNILRILLKKEERRVQLRTI